MRTKVEWRSASKKQYENFCKYNPNIKLSFIEWKNILYSFNDSFRSYILETGDKGKLPSGFGDFSINKKKRKRIKIRPSDGKEFINLPIDWKKSKEMGKHIYLFNYHTEGYYFGWIWFKKSARLPQSELWYFKPSRVTSRILNHYLKIDEKYQHIYKSWKP